MCKSFTAQRWKRRPGEGSLINKLLSCPSSFSWSLFFKSLAAEGGREKRKHSTYNWKNVFPLFSFLGILKETEILTECAECWWDSATVYSGGGVTMSESALSHYAHGVTSLSFLQHQSHHFDCALLFCTLFCVAVLHQLRPLITDWETGSHDTMSPSDSDA